ncbi:MAG: ABC transporter permease [Oscillospiraceae bacterium]|jgi:ABC-type polysaccharide/polyol phosphate export permease|nr:ABC transporter permease [Oscillospiraceae bacterium]
MAKTLVQETGLLSALCVQIERILPRGLKPHWQRFMKYRFLLQELVRKNVRLQYRGSALGLLWSFVQPLLFALVLSFVFSAIFKRGDVSGVPYFLYLLSGRLMFSFYSDATSSAMRSVRQNSGILKKVYVPKYIYPMSAVVSRFVMFLLSLPVLVVFMVVFNYVQINDGISFGHFFTFGYHLRVLYALVPIVILLVFAMGVGLLLSSISVFFRDTEYIYSVFTQLLMYLTPLFYSPDDIKTSEGLKKILRANPLYGLITMFRNVLFYSPGVPDLVANENPFFYSGFQLGYVAFIASVFLIVGGVVFKLTQDKFILHL